MHITSSIGAPNRRASPEDVQRVSRALDKAQMSNLHHDGQHGLAGCPCGQDLRPGIAEQPGHECELRRRDAGQGVRHRVYAGNRVPVGIKRTQQPEPAGSSRSHARTLDEARTTEGLSASLAPVRTECIRQIGCVSDGPTDQVCEQKLKSGYGVAYEQTRRPRWKIQISQERLIDPHGASFESWRQECYITVSEQAEQHIGVSYKYIKRTHL